MIRLQLKTPCWTSRANTPERLFEYHMIRWLINHQLRNDNSSFHFDNDKEAGTQFLCFGDTSDAMLFKLTFGEWLK